MLDAPANVDSYVIYRTVDASNNYTPFRLAFRAFLFGTMQGLDRFRNRYFVKYFINLCTQYFEQSIRVCFSIQLVKLMLMRT
jgi:hypothetical protein